MKKPRATLTYIARTDARGLVVAFTSNAKKITVKYKLGRKSKTKTLKVRAGSASFTVPAKATKPRARAKATKKLRASAWLALAPTPIPIPIPVPTPPVVPPAPAPAPVPPAPVPTPAPTPINPLDTFLAEGAVSLSGVDPAALNPQSASFTFNLTGASFSADPADTGVKVNGTAVPTSKVAVSGQSVTVSGALVDGRNELALSSYDTEGRTLHHQEVIWAGSRDLTVQLIDSASAPFLAKTHVELRLVDDPDVLVQADTSTGSVVFGNLPVRTVLISGKAAGNVTGAVGGAGSAGTMQLKMLGFNAPSGIANNDFSAGTAGWDVGSSPVSIVAHEENVGPSTDSAASAQGSPVDRTQARTSSPADQAASPATDAIVDQDLSLGTSGQGERTISRTFKTDPSTVAVKLRYRFITSEVPGGYFGTKYNDYFRVSLRSQTGGGSATEANSMNGLGLAAFDGGGSTAWRNITLPVDIDGDNIQVDLAVANVADALLDSQVVVDFVEEVKVRIIPTLAWNNTQGGLDLRFQIVGATLPEAKPLNVWFANGPGYANRIGAPVFTHNIAANTAEGSYGPFHVPGNSLAADPDNASHLIAAALEADVGPIPDVTVGFGANANPAVVSAGMLDAVEDGLREAGQSAATIQSTARTPADQARAMFNNLTNPAHTIAENIAIQQGIYAPPGDAVINAFATAVAGQTPAQIQANSAAIQAAMVTEINNQGCPNVTRHCADPAVVSVVDVGAAAFNPTNGAIFFNSVTGRVANSIDERNTNGCYHFEL